MDAFRARIPPPSHRALIPVPSIAFIISSLEKSPSRWRSSWSSRRLFRATVYATRRSTWRPRTRAELARAIEMVAVSTTRDVGLGT